MDKRAKPKLFIEYVLDNIKIFAMFVLLELIFIAVCALYQADSFFKLLYSVYISLFIGICYIVWDFYKYIARIDKFSEAFENIENVLNILPAPNTSSEREYHHLIDNLYNEMQQLSFRENLKETDMKNYYSMWAHQIKTPISAMRLMLQSNGSEVSPFAMEEELFKVEQYVEMVLHYLRLESISSDMLLREYELKDIVNAAVKKNAVLFINTKLSINIRDFSHRVLTDEKWLLFVIEQLITNAVKYTPEGGISIYLDDKEGDTWLAIEDTGIGIREEDLPRIFEKGFTGYNGRLNKKSTGIGLYLCKQVLDKLSHRITVESRLGKGTKVCIDVSERESFNKV